MDYLIIETFHKGKVKALYQRFAEKGRMMPKGVKYVNSWIDESIEVCYQIMESDSLEKLQEWVSYWSDLADFKIIPVLTSTEAKEKILQEEEGEK